MKIIVVGCGKIGTSILSSLAGEGNDVVAIDASPKVIEEIGNIYDVMCVCGNGTDCETLEEAGVNKAELFVAVTGSDEFNMLSCFIAARMGAKHTIARIRNPEYNDKSLGFLRQQLGLTVSINPEWMAANELYNILKLPAAASIEQFSRGNIEMVVLSLKQESPLDGLSLTELRKKYKAKFLICAVQRGNKVYIPDGNFTLKSGDKIGLTAPPNELQKLLKMLGLVQKSARNVMILGASRIAYYLAKRLLASGNSVKIIDKDRERCREFAELLPDAVVICGDPADSDVLTEEGIDNADAFVALTGFDEEKYLSQFEDRTYGKDGLEGLKERIDDEYLKQIEMLEEIIIRFGTELEKEKLLTDYPNIQNVIGDGGYFIIAEIKDTVVGYLWAFKRKIPAPVEQSEIFINIIEVIRTNLRCQGIASQMLNVIINTAKQEDVYQVRAYCDIKNVPSHRLWMKNKFSISPVKMPDGSIVGSFVTYVL